MQLVRRSTGFILLLLVLLGGCGSPGEVLTLPTLIPSLSPEVQAPVSAQEVLNRTRTPLSFDQLRALQTAADPPYSQDLTPFRQEQDYRRRDGSVAHEVSVHYETPDFPIVTLTEPVTRTGSTSSHQSALVTVVFTGAVLELDINISPGSGLASPLNFHRGDNLILKGEYIITDPAERSAIDDQHHNVIHWTHHSGNSNHPGGHVILRGVTYQ